MSAGAYGPYRGNYLGGGVYEDEFSDLNGHCHGVHHHHRSKGAAAPNNTTRVNPRVVRVDPDKVVDDIAPKIRYFREMGVYTEESYNRLLLRLCKACGIPTYPKNLPQFFHDESIDDRGRYEGDDVGKRLILKRISDVAGFVALWHIYLKHRQRGFASEEEETVGKSKFPENRYAKKVLKKARPQQVRNWEDRVFITEEEI